MNRIGIWNTAFLGDAVLTIPLLRTVKAAYPDAELHFFVRKGLGGLFSAQPEIAAVHEYDKRGEQKGFFSAVQYGKQLSHMGFTLWISAHTSIRSGVIARWTSARRRIGYNRPRINSWLYTHTVDRRFEMLDEIERLLELVTPLGITHTLDWPELVLPGEAYTAAEQFWQNTLACEGRVPPVLGVHPGSVWATKRWPARYYADVVRKGAESGAQVLVFAGPGEEKMAQEVLDHCNVLESGRVHNLASQLSLPELAAYLGKLDCYVTNDSGPMHLAWAQRTPVTAIFGPTVSKLGFYPRGEHATVFETDMPCRPCGLHGPQACPEQHFRCMLDVTPETVWFDVQEKLFSK